MKLHFYSNKISDPSASIIDNFRPGEEIKYSKYITINTIDNIAKSCQLDEVTMIKIDVEGAELEVIESLIDLLKRNKPIILIEILPVYSEKNRSRLERQQKIEVILKKLDYLTYRVKKKGSKFESLEKIESLGVHSNLEACDYVFKPKTNP